MAEYKVGSLGALISGDTGGTDAARIVYKPVPSDIKGKKIADENITSATKDEKKLLGKGRRDGPKALGRRAKKRELIKKNTSKHLFDPEKEARTIFVGNIPHKFSNRTELTKKFAQYGEVDSIRFRCVPLKNPNASKKVAVIKKEFHESRSNINAYIVFQTPEAATSALAANGTVYHDHHLRVDMAGNSSSKAVDNKKCVFVGNLSFVAEEEDLWKIFSKCGTIENVRIIRDSLTSVSKGIAFVTFESADGAELALTMDGELVKKRPMCVRRFRRTQIKSFSDNTIRHKSGDEEKEKIKIKEQKQYTIRQMKKEKRSLQRVKLDKKKSKLDSNKDTAKSQSDKRIDNSEESVKPNKKKSKQVTSSNSNGLAESDEPAKKKSKQVTSGNSNGLAESDEPAKKKSKQVTSGNSNGLAESAEPAKKKSKQVTSRNSNKLAVSDEPAKKKSKHVTFGNSKESTIQEKIEFQGQTFKDSKKTKKRKVNKGEIKKRKFAKVLAPSTLKKKKTLKS